MSGYAIAHTENRQFERYALSIDVSAHSGHQFFTGFTENVSAGGLFISTYQTLEIGTQFELNFTVPTLDYEFVVTCEVRWVREYNPDTPDVEPGMGVKFVDLSETETRLLAEVLRQSETLFYDE